MSPEFKGLVGLGYFRPSANISGCRVFRVARNSLPTNPPRPSAKISGLSCFPCQLVKTLC